MKTKSFTLIELLVVIVIIGILAAVIIVSTSSSISKASIAKVKVFENSVLNELGANMVSRWKLDEIVSTTTTPDAWGSNTGTLVNGPVLKSESECVTGKCMYFDGVDDYIDCGNDGSLNIADEITISSWIKLDSFDSHWRAITSKGNYNTGVVFWIAPNVGSLTFSSGGIHYYSSNYIKLNKWLHLAVTFSKSTGKIITYKDGVSFLSETARTDSLLINTRSFYIGIEDIGIYPSGYGQFKGLIDDVRIYNTALSTSQIKQEYIAGLNSLLANNNISKEEYDQRLNSLSFK